MRDDVRFAFIHAEPLACFTFFQYACEAFYRKSAPPAGQRHDKPRATYQQSPMMLWNNIKVPSSSAVFIL